MLGLESNICRLCVVKIKRQKTDKPFDKRACFRQSCSTAECLFGARASSFEQTSCFYFRCYFITIFDVFVRSYCLLSDTADNVVRRTVPGADWVLWWLGRSPFAPDPTHSHSTEPGNSAAGRQQAQDGQPAIPRFGCTFRVTRQPARERNALLDTCLFTFGHGRETR